MGLAFSSKLATQVRCGQLQQRLTADDEYTAASDDTSSAPPMVDVIFVVNDAVSWHTQNMQLHPEHYSSFAKLGASAVAWLQGLPAGLYFNTSVPLPTTGGGSQSKQLLKYGVITTADFLHDLSCWRSVYVAGRLHKPVRFLSAPPAPIAAALQRNIAAASAAALLMLPSSFNLQAMLHAIAGLSYTGDFRMAVGENPYKVSNIVTQNMHHFNALYFGSSRQQEALECMGLQLPGGQLAPAQSMRSLPAACAYASRSVHCRQSDTRLQATMQHIPRAFRFRMLRAAGVPPEDMARALDGEGRLPKRSHLQRALQRTVADTVAPAAAIQSIKGIATAGPAKSAVYALAKLRKQLRGLLRR